jgi:hypothetical protein
MKKNKNQLQQGDVILLKLKAMPAGEQKRLAVGRCVVAHGESGHSHVIEDDEAELIEIGERMLLKLGKAVPLTHEEHHHIQLEPGIYEIGRVQEYDYFQHMARRVID